MKRIFSIMMLTSTLALSACNVAQQTSSARAAYGNAVNEFKANNKKNQKRKKKARKEVKRKKSRSSSSYWHRRPY